MFSSNHDLKDTAPLVKIAWFHKMLAEQDLNAGGFYKYTLDKLQLDAKQEFVD